jgi:hypothetical protein
MNGLLHCPYAQWLLYLFSDSTLKNAVRCWYFYNKQWLSSQTTVSQWRHIAFFEMKEINEYNIGLDEFRASDS